MSDTMELIVADKQIKRVTSYAIDSNIYNAAGSFKIGLHPSYISQIKKGDRVTVKINGATVLRGLVDRPGLSGRKDSLEMTVIGRDLMGLVVDYHIETFRTLKNKKLADVAELYLRQIDYVRDLDITYLNGTASLDVAQEYTQPQPGQTVFELLSGIAAARGVHFYLRPDGNLVFGKPAGSGRETFAIWHTADGNSNVIDFDYGDDGAQQFSRVTVVGTAQSGLDAGLKTISKKATVTDTGFPFAKPFVVETDTAAKTPEQQARMIMEQQRADGFRLQYTVGGHTQRGHIWEPDALCAIDDFRIPLREEFVIYGRTFTLEKTVKNTRVLLGKLGLKK